MGFVRIQVIDELKMEFELVKGLMWLMLENAVDILANYLVLQSGFVTGIDTTPGKFSFAV